MTTTPRSAFSLIEVLIAIALSSVLIYAIFSAFRVAMGSMQASRRLAMENALMRYGLTRALDEVDFWTAYDDPDDLSRQGLRISRAALPEEANGQAGYPADNGAGWQLGAPFAPMANTWPWRRVGGPRELERGYDPDERWRAADARTWWRGSLAQPWWSDLRWGRYGMVANVQTSAVLGGWCDLDGSAVGYSDAAGRNEIPNQPGSSTPVLLLRDAGFKYGPPGGSGTRVIARTGPYGTVAVPHTWRDNQLVGLRNALGFYGMMEYLPANAVAAVHGSIVERAAGGARVRLDERMPDEWVKPFQDNEEGQANVLAVSDPFNQSSGLPQGRTALTAPVTPLYPYSPFTGAWVNGGIGNESMTGTNAMLFQQLSTPVTTWPAADVIGWHHRHQQASARDDAGESETFLRMARELRPMLPERPETVPELHTGVLRYALRDRFVCLLTVRVVNPVHGVAMEFTFSALGTSLRGARQQRGSAGWARVDLELDPGTGLPRLVSGPDTLTLDAP